ncbi:MAG: oligosaccharide flippase family protein [Opitutaceae bacterium]|nr:oligosaccharide flippase family protein [Opitutaceae bacterium]
MKLSNSAQPSALSKGEDLNDAHVLGSGIFWTTAGSLSTKALRPLSLLVLARLLSPSDYGVMATAMIVIEALKLLKDIGVGQAFIRSRGDTAAMLNLTFWVQLGVGAFLTGLLLLSADLIASGLGNSEIAPILRLMSLLFVIWPFGDAPLNLMLKQLDFRSAFYRQAIPAFSAPLVSIVMAAQGFGVWALAVASVVAALATSVTVMLLVRWRPEPPKFNGHLLKEALSFGGHVTLQNVLAWLGNFADQLIVVRFQSATNVGLLRTGMQLGTIGWEIVAGPFSAITLPWFARLDSVQAGQAYLRAIRMLSIFSLPLNVFLAAFFFRYVGFILGPKWAEAGAIVSIYALLNSISCIMGLNGEVLKAIGRADVATKLGLARVAMVILPFIWAASQSIYHLAFAHAVMAWATGLLFTPFVTRCLGLRIGEVLRACGEGLRLALPVAVIGLGMQWVEAANGKGLFSLTLGMVLMGAALALIVLRYHRADIQSLYSIFAKRRSRQSQ